jgi:hypothetical protein
MKAKKKPCDGGCGEITYIWKTVRDNGETKRYCKTCWSRHTSAKNKPTKRKALSPLSPKRKGEFQEYLKKRKIFLEKHPICEAKIPGICMYKASDVHHMKGRIGDLYLDERYWKALCRICHEYCETHKQEALERGLSLPRH